MNAIKLLQELADANIEWNKALIPDDNEISVIFRDGTDMDLVQQIIGAHDPTPISPSPTKQEVFEQQITANTDYLLDVDFRLILFELGIF